jgi:hypothetical protein
MTILQDCGCRLGVVDYRWFFEICPVGNFCPCPLVKWVSRFRVEFFRGETDGLSRILTLPTYSKGKREHGFGCGSVETEDTAVGSSSEIFNLSKERNTVSTFLFGCYRDYSLCSISKHPKKNAEELACLGLC